MKLCQTHGIHQGPTCPICKARRAQANTATYGDPTYRRNRKIALRRTPYCQTCNTTIDLTVDHITPVNAGGTHHLTNLQVLCRSCNGRKSDRVF